MIDWVWDIFCYVNADPITLGGLNTPWDALDFVYGQNPGLSPMNRLCHSITTRLSHGTVTPVIAGVKMMYTKPQSTIGLSIPI